MVKLASTGIDIPGNDERLLTRLLARLWTRLLTRLLTAPHRYSCFVPPIVIQHKSRYWQVCEDSGVDTRAGARATDVCLLCVRRSRTVDVDVDDDVDPDLPNDIVWQH